jgi:prepilin-type N-terminal cleavage/methylation domain-containing protein/prepilin-type processing-associated H-X9-DG protein
MQYFRPRSAFTLIELLVVVAIIGVLIAILLPALGHAREKAKVAVCGTQMKQWANGFQLYAQQYSNQLPIDGGLGTAGSPIGLWSDNALWFNGIAQQLNSGGRSYFDMIQASSVAGGPALPRIGSKSIFICPSDTDVEEGSSQDQVVEGYYQTTGLLGGATVTENILITYAMNAQLRALNYSSTYPPTPQPMDVALLTRLRMPTAVVLIGEKRTDPDEISGSDPYWSQSLTPCKVSPPNAAARHSKGSNIAFADAHVEWTPYRKIMTTTTDPLYQFNQADLIWQPSK